jgi:hypothetical protein
MKIMEKGTFFLLGVNRAIKLLRTGSARRLTLKLRGACDL